MQPQDTVTQARRAAAPSWLKRTASFLQEKEEKQRMLELKEREERARAKQQKTQEEERLRRKREDIQARLTGTWKEMGLDSALADIVGVVWPGGHVHRGFFTQDSDLEDYRLLGLIYQTHVYRETRMVGPEGLTIKSYSFWIARVLFSVALYEDRLELGSELPSWSDAFWRGMFKNMDGIEVQPRDKEVRLLGRIADRRAVQSILDEYLSRQLGAEEPQT
jgi:hypothetical protein